MLGAVIFLLEMAKNAVLLATMSLSLGCHCEGRSPVAIRNTLLGNGFPRLLRSLGMTRLLNLMTLGGSRRHGAKMND